MSKIVYTNIAPPTDRKLAQAALALYLASDESAFTTGQIHVIDGGWTN